MKFNKVGKPQWKTNDECLFIKYITIINYIILPKYAIYPNIYDII